MQARHEVMRAGQVLREAAGCESTTSVRAVTLHTEGQHQPGYVLGKTMVAPGPEIYPAPLRWHLPPNNQIQRAP